MADRRKPSLPLVAGMKGAGIRRIGPPPPTRRSRPTSSDRNLLFGILALQMDFVTRDALVAAMNAWVLDKQSPSATSCWTSVRSRPMSTTCSTRW